MLDSSIRQVANHELPWLCVAEEEVLGGVTGVQVTNAGVVPQTQYNFQTGPKHARSGRKKYLRSERSLADAERAMTDARLLAEPL